MPDYRRQGVSKQNAEDLQQDLVAAGTESLVCRIRHTVNAERVYVRTPRCTPILTQKLNN